jgi:CheY-like chemotaxis protein
VNAIEAMPDGGTLGVTTTIEGGEAIVTVSDTGDGMTAEIQRKIFAPFFTTKEHGKGSGLGLSMVYGFAKQSHGHVKIYSEVGHGTTVRLYLPRAPQQTTLAKPEAPEPVEPTTIKATVLVVEDNVDVRRIVCKLLQDFGCTVLEANSGATALEILQSGQKIDLMFSDVVMPGGMSGTELVQAARRLRPGIKTLLTTGFAEASLRNQVQFADAGEVLSKPYRRQDLARKIRSILGLNSAQ